VGCGLGRFVGLKFSLCDGLGSVWLKKFDARTTLDWLQTQSTKAHSSCDVTCQ